MNGMPPCLHHPYNHQMSQCWANTPVKCDRVPMLLPDSSINPKWKMEIDEAYGQWLDQEDEGA